MIGFWPPCTTPVIAAPGTELETGVDEVEIVLGVLEQPETRIAHETAASTKNSRTGYLPFKGLSSYVA